MSIESIKENVEKKYAEFMQLLADENLKVIALEKKNQELENNFNIISKQVSTKLNVDEKLFLEYLRKPTMTIKKNDSYFVYSPKWHPFQYGWWVGTVDNFNIYKIDHYTKWFSEIPDFLKSEFEGEMPEVTLDNDIIKFNPVDREKLKKILTRNVADWTDSSVRITKGNNFEVVASIIDSGRIPFTKNPVDANDVIKSNSITLLKWQTESYNTFLKTGAVGIFLPTGAGKSFIAMKAMESIKGKHLVVTYGVSLVEQWKYYIETFIPHRKDDITVLHYQSVKQLEDEYALTIYDECHRLPATTFSRFALIKTKYRMGLSATPYREDNKQKYIVALTGFPVGTDWNKYLAERKTTLHKITLHLVKLESSKSKIVKKLLNDKKTWVFSDSIELGTSIAKILNIPFVNGETDNRMEIINSNKHIVISRVGDMGISVKDLQHIIEVDFQFGSRQQELQRTGRLMHSLEKNLKHDIIMTYSEFASYGKRIWALQEKGFKVQTIEYGNANG